MERALKDLRMFSTSYIKEMHKKESKCYLDDLNDLIFDITKWKKDGDYIICWYTRHTFVFGMINNTIRKRNLLEMFYIRILIFLLNHQLTN